MFIHVRSIPEQKLALVYIHNFALFLIFCGLSTHTKIHTQQQQQLKKLGIIIYYLDNFNHNRSLHTPMALGQTVL
jgi:hypothetical protein